MIYLAKESQFSPSTTFTGLKHYYIKIFVIDLCKSGPTIDSK